MGKTALIDQLRPVVTRSDGWFVSGKFDRYRRDPEFNAGHQAFRALGRLLLAEPEDELRQLSDAKLTDIPPSLPERRGVVAVDSNSTGVASLLQIRAGVLR